MTDEATRPKGIRLSHKTQLALAAGMWSAVGIALPVVGLLWAVQTYGPIGALFAAPFLLVGLLKSKILDRVSAGTVTHIRERDPYGFVLGFLPLRSWLLIGGMMAVGQLLRRIVFGPASVLRYPIGILGFVYVAVGSALLLSSRKLWRCWREQPA